MNIKLFSNKMKKKLRYKFQLSFQMLMKFVIIQLEHIRNK